MTSKERSAIEDGAGNVRFCGEFLYAFDAWNRLVAVWKARRVDHATVLPSASAPLAGVEVGNWVKRFRYDALGRLIEVVSPMAGPDWPDEGGKLERMERFWYDGSRRIQEVVIDPTDLLYVVNKYGTEGLVEYITTGLVNAETGPPTGVPFRALNREYIWGAGVGGGQGGSTSCTCSSIASGGRGACCRTATGTMWRWWMMVGRWWRSSCTTRTAR